MLKQCWGHGEREARKNKISKLLTSAPDSLDDLRKVLIKKGPVSEETSLKELEEIYASSEGWRTEWERSCCTNGKLMILHNSIHDIEIYNIDLL